MQIQTGKYRGRKLQRASCRSIRPCSSRVKKSLFDTLAVRMDFEGISVLDLFAGFGSLGFEALSRGADRVCFVDQNVHALRSLQATAENLGAGAQVRIVKQDVLRFLSSSEDVFDLVFCDPPYSWPDYPALISTVFSRRVVARGGLLLVEHSTEHDFGDQPHFLFCKDYGMTRVTFFSQEAHV
ncbi:MAG: 16S rRNA (guanine(966)-N(2))-methyltransferase RsmD [Prosthecochloris sp.]|nr:16S rRNA (guanine(966)-N(2))-methyltransferase RsmD [Prosthecochloris sp.]